MLACSRYRFKCWGRTANPYISLQSLIPQQQQQKPTDPKSYSQTGVTHNTGEKNRKCNNAFPKKQTKKKKSAPTLRRASNSSCRLFPPTPEHCGPELQHRASVCVLLTTDQIPSPSPTSLSLSLSLSLARSLAFISCAFPSSPYNMRKTKQWWWVVGELPGNVVFSYCLLSIFRPSPYQCSFGQICYVVKMAIILRKI
jgi:hypothetical protein